MKKSVIQALFTVFVIVLMSNLFSQSVNAKVYHVENFPNGQPDGITDNTSAFQAAVNKVVEDGSGTVSFGALANTGKPFKICGDIRSEGTSAPFGEISIAFEGNGSNILTCENQDQVMFIFSNVIHYKISNVNIFPKTQNDSDKIDTYTILFASQWAGGGELENFNLHGLRFYGKAIQVQGDLTIRNSTFSGNASVYCLICSEAVDTSTPQLAFQFPTRRLNVEKVTVLDYSNAKLNNSTDNYWSKTPVNSGSWIVSNGLLNLTVSDGFFDEGAAIAIRARNTQNVEINRTTINVSGIDGGSGIYLRNVKSARLTAVNTRLTTEKNDLIVVKNDYSIVPQTSTPIVQIIGSKLEISWEPDLPTNAKFVSSNNRNSLNGSIFSLINSDEFEVRNLNGHHNGWMYSDDLPEVEGEGVSFFTGLNKDSKEKLVRDRIRKKCVRERKCR